METGSELFNLDQCRGLTSLVIVEAPLDALIATARGIPGVVACGRNKPTDKQLDDIRALGVTTVTLALDADTAGQTGTEDTIYRLASRKIASYVLAYPEGIKDLGEDIKQSNAEGVLTRIEAASASYNYLIECLHSKHSKSEVLTDKEQRALLDELIELDAKLNDDLASKAVIDYMSGRLELAPETIKQALKDNRESKAQAECQKGFQQLSAQTAQLVKANKYEEAEELITDTMPSLRAKNVHAIIEPYTSDNFITDLQARHEGYSTGFRELDEYALIPSEALTVIAGRPRHGKTTVMLNMLYNLVTTYSDKRFYFFSYEETRSQLALKLITIMSGIQLDQYKNTQKIEAYFKTGRLDVSYLANMTESDAKSALNRAKEEYDHLIKTGRLWIVDEPMLVTDLTGIIEELAASQGNIGAVFVDYVQKIKSKFNAPTRQVEIQKVSAELLDTAKRAGIAIVVGCQFGRAAEKINSVQGLSLDQLRESGDIEQDAHLVLGLYNHAAGESDADPEASTNANNSPITTIDIKILKNRSGVANKTTSVVFNAPTLTITSALYPGAVQL
jgi:replicative DNA helicase